ncbi:MAG: hypothetical protein AAGU11_01990 [Syntrophobacteraceae bacterium]
MKRCLVALSVCVSILIATPASADKYDAEWVAECVEDNQDANVSIEVVTRYCTCMNDKMSYSETLSITEWERIHPAERAECSRQAGWR